MANYMYIAGSFMSLDRPKCGGGKAWLDNDPHFWTTPPTWGICRPDLREKIDIGNYVFFVLPKKAKYPQMIFGYMMVKNKVTHWEAYNKVRLKSKRMANKNTNGNIIVDGAGRYNRYDMGYHKKGFEKIKLEYVIGGSRQSKLLEIAKINKLAPGFVSKIASITGKKGKRLIDIISRYGLQLSDAQVDKLLAWLNA